MALQKRDRGGTDPVAIPIHVRRLLFAPSIPGTTRSPRRNVGLAGSLLALAWAAPALADPQLDPVFGSGAVLQRGKPILVEGSADPRERVTVRLGGATKVVRADANGRWRVLLPAMPAGGPHRLTATGLKVEAIADDLLIGDVWLCSGQSNMELPVQRALNWPTELKTAADPKLRLLSIPQRYFVTPQFKIGDTRWRSADSESVVSFSAACFFMMRELRKSQDVPIGAIDASWGGTQIRPWIPASAATTLPNGPEDMALLALYDRDSGAAGARFGTRWEAWWRETTAQHAGEEPWRAPNRIPWHPVPRIGPWESWGEPRLDPFTGMVWFRRTVALTPAQAAAGATLDLGVIEDMDVTWINGVVAGSGYGRTLQRSYKLPAAQLRPGNNEIVINVLNTAGSGGFQGPIDAVKLTLADGVTLPLIDGWRYAIQLPKLDSPPRAPWESHAGLGTIYNAMIAPLGAMGLTGVAWYQGESDSGKPGYDMRLAAMMAGWRRQFDAPKLPFLIVSLAGFGQSDAEPLASGRAQVRDDQRRAAARDPHAAIVIALDLGDQSDIHPANKQEVGRRLSRAAKALAYGADLTPSGPRVAGAEREADGVVVRFADVTGALEAWSATRPIGFELCGPTQASCRWATATIDGSTVSLAGDGQPATRVRYAWGDTPVINLYDGARLPVGPFEVPIAD